MPQLQSVVITDRETTPVNHTLVPRDIAGGVGVVVESSGVSVGELKLSVSMRKSAAKFRGRLVLDSPVVATEVINGISSPKVIRRAIANVEFVFDELSTLQERNNLVGMLASALVTSKVLVNDAIVKLEGVY